jgi:beta-phosphoglucomutase-like phosphatase (HAD superfamily)
MHEVADKLPSRGALKAVILDVDGTLYRQGPLRRQMLLRLLKAHAVRPVAGFRTFRALQAYRHAQEHLREALSEDGAARQLQLASERARLPVAVVAQSVERWMEQEPLALLRGCLQPAVEAFLHACRDAGVTLAALSDYPPDAKLEAMGLKSLFSATFCAQTRDIGVFKPHPKGILVALERLGVSPDHAIYVGDRADVDGAAAHAAGIACAILTDQPGSATDRHVSVASFGELRARLFDIEPSAR